MSRFLLALRCFFAVLLRFRLPPQAIALLPPPDLGGVDNLPVAGALPAQPAPEPAAAPAAAVPAPPEPAPAVAAPPAATVAAPPAAASEPAVSAEERDAVRNRGVVQLLAVLQREGRLLDFLMEDIDGYSDGQIGAAVRDIHRGCRKALSEHLQIDPIRPEPDEAVVRIESGHDPSQVRLIGQVRGRPPFEGTLRHHGWRTRRIQLSDIPPGHDPSVICPAEVELGG